MTKIIFFEFPDEIDKFAESHTFNDFLVIPLTIEAKIYLTKKDINFSNTLKYFTNESHRKCSLKGYEWHKKIEKELNLECDGIKETYNNTALFNIYFYINHFLYYTEILHNVVKSENVECIFGFESAEYYSSDPLILERQHYLWKIIKQYCKNNGTQCELIYMDGGEGVFERKYETFESKLFKRYLKNKKLYFTTSLGYNMKKFMKKTDVPWAIVRNEGILQCVKETIYHKLTGTNVIVIPSGLFASVYRLEGNLGLMWDVVTNDFENRTVDFYRVFSDKLNVDLELHLNDLYNESIMLKNLADWCNIKLLVSPYARESALLFAEICQNVGIPTMLISHGTVGKVRNEVERIENWHIGKTLMLSNFDNVAIQTPQESEAFEFFRCKAKKIVCKPQILCEVKKGNKRKILGTDKFVFLYAESMRTRMNHRFHVFETPDEFLESCRELVEVMEEIDAVLVIKLHPGRKWNCEDLQSLLPKSDNLMVVDGKLDEILGVSDAVIGFSSTVIEDALQNKIPVVMYDRVGRYRIFDENSKGLFYIRNGHGLKGVMEIIMDGNLNFSEYVF